MVTIVGKRRQKIEMLRQPARGTFVPSSLSWLRSVNRFCFQFNFFKRVKPYQREVLKNILKNKIFEIMKILVVKRCG